MNFRSKMHMVQELIAGKQFESHTGAVIYYNEAFSNPFRYDEDEMRGIWDSYSLDIWNEVEPRHVHQDLIDSYQKGQAWQYTEPHMDGLYQDCKCHNVWVEPCWDESTIYRLHPHSDLIQAHRNGAKIQVYSNDEWVDIELEPCWHEGSQYRIKPNTTVVHEWMFRPKCSNNLVIMPELMSEEKAKRYFIGNEYRKTGRSWEVEV